MVRQEDNLEGLQNDVHVWSYHSCTKIHPSLLESKSKMLGMVRQEDSLEGLQNDVHVWSYQSCSSFLKDVTFTTISHHQLHFGGNPKRAARLAASLIGNFSRIMHVKLNSYFIYKYSHKPFRR